MLCLLLDERGVWSLTPLTAYLARFCDDVSAILMESVMDVISDHQLVSTRCSMRYPLRACAIQRASDFIKDTSAAIDVVKTIEEYLLDDGGSRGARDRAQPNIRWRAE